MREKRNQKGAGTRWLLFTSSDVSGSGLVGTNTAPVSSGNHTAIPIAASPMTSVSGLPNKR